MEKVVPLTLRKKLALELWRVHDDNMRSEHPLQQLFWECTLRCNLHCLHCGSDCKAVAAQQDMPAEDFYRVLDSIAARQDPHKVFVIISGGEPLMRKDLEEVCAEINRRGFPWGMVTNGLFLTLPRYQTLLKAGLRSITVSLDGLQEEHNWMRGNNKSFQMVDQALSMLTRTKNLTYDVVTCVNRRNYPTLHAIKDYLIEKGMTRWRIFSVFPVGRAAEDPQMKLTPDEFRGMFQFIREARKEGRIRVDYGCEGFLGNLEGEVRDHLFTCQAGVTIGSVLCDGSISACTSIRGNYHQGNIYQDDFMDVWENRFQSYRNREWMHKDDCKDCAYFRYCKGNGMHLRDDEGRLLFCNLKQLISC